jgi:hypothetical protein
MHIKNPAVRTAGFFYANFIQIFVDIEYTLKGVGRTVFIESTVTFPTSSQRNGDRALVMTQPASLNPAPLHADKNTLLIEDKSAFRVL